MESDDIVICVVIICGVFYACFMAYLGMPF